MIWRTKIPPDNQGTEDCCVECKELADVTEGWIGYDRGVIDSMSTLSKDVFSIKTDSMWFFGSPPVRERSFM